MNHSHIGKIRIRNTYTKHIKDCDLMNSRFNTAQIKSNKYYSIRASTYLPI